MSDLHGFDSELAKKVFYIDLSQFVIYNYQAAAKYDLNAEKEACEWLQTLSGTHFIDSKIANQNSS